MLWIWFQIIITNDAWHRHWCAAPRIDSRFILQFSPGCNFCLNITPWRPRGRGTEEAIELDSRFVYIVATPMPGATRAAVEGSLMRLIDCCPLKTNAMFTYYLERIADDARFRPGYQPPEPLYCRASVFHLILCLSALISSSRLPIFEQYLISRLIGITIELRSMPWSLYLLWRRHWAVSHAASGVTPRDGQLLRGRFWVGTMCGFMDSLSNHVLLHRLFEYIPRFRIGADGASLNHRQPFLRFCVFTRYQLFLLSATRECAVNWSMRTRYTHLFLYRHYSCCYEHEESRWGDATLLSRR